MIDNVQATLVNELTQISRDIAKEAGWLRSICDNPDWHAIMNDETISYPLAISSRAVTMHLITNLARLWDESKKENIVSLPQVMAKLGEAKTELDEYESLRTSKVTKKIRVFRTEWLAHRAPKSNDRDRLKIEDEECTYHELVQHAEDSLGVIEKLFSSLGIESPQLLYNITRTDEHCRETWARLARLNPPGAPKSRA